MATPDYGLDAELKAKAAAKYDPELEGKVVAWIEAITGEKKEGAFGDWLKDGKVLCNLVNCIRPGTIKKINQQAMPFKQMENITYFMNTARDWGVPENSLFGTPDLYEAKNLGSVVNCINVFGGAVQAQCKEFAGPKLGLEIMTESRDKKRGSQLTVNQSGGYAGTCEVERPRDGNIVRGTAQISPRPSVGGTTTSPRPAAGAAQTSSPRPVNATSPRPAAEGGGDEGPSTAKRGSVNADGSANFGLDAELKAKQEAKYDVGLEGEVTQWIQTITGKQRGEASMQEWLKDGSVLCDLANKVKPGSVKKVNTSTLAFKQMENITFFMDAARDMGVPENSMFGTPDLYEDKNMGTVINALFTYGGAIQQAIPSFTPKLGVALTHESKDKQREAQKTKKLNQSGGYSTTQEVERPQYGMKR